MRIAVTCGPTSQGFLAPVEKLLRDAGHEVARFTLDARSPQSFIALEKWKPDAIWHEWCDSLAAALSRASGPPMVVRLHRFEADTDWPARVQWSDRCRLVVTSQHIAARVAAPSVVIPSIVDFDAFPLVTDRPRDFVEAAVVGYIEGRKQPGLAVAAFVDVQGHFPKVARLRFIGTPKEPFWREYLTGGSGLTLEPWTDNVAAIWQTARVCISASAAEGCPYNVIEAMACGATPLVHAYEGAELQFPQECLWRLPSHASMAMAMLGGFTPLQIRAWAAARYSIEANRDAVLGLFR